jgi:hypothetical protein
MVGWLWMMNRKEWGKISRYVRVLAATGMHHIGSNYYVACIQMGKMQGIQPVLFVDFSSSGHPDVSSVSETNRSISKKCFSLSLSLHVSVAEKPYLTYPRDYGLKSSGFMLVFRCCRSSHLVKITTVSNRTLSSVLLQLLLGSSMLPTSNNSRSWSRWSHGLSLSSS